MKENIDVDQVLEHLTREQLDMISELSPDLYRLMLEYGYENIYARPGLDHKSRKIATLSSLITSGNVKQIHWHIIGALEKGLLTKQEVRELIIQMVLYVGFPAALNAMQVANEAFAAIKD